MWTCVCAFYRCKCVCLSACIQNIPTFACERYSYLNVFSYKMIYNKTERLSVCACMLWLKLDKTFTCATVDFWVCVSCFRYFFAVFVVDKFVQKEVGSDACVLIFFFLFFEFVIHFLFLFVTLFGNRKCENNWQLLKVQCSKEKFSSWTLLECFFFFFPHIFHRKSKKYKKFLDHFFFGPKNEETQKEVCFLLLIGKFFRHAVAEFLLQTCCTV